LHENLRCTKIYKPHVCNAAYLRTCLHFNLQTFHVTPPLAPNLSDTPFVFTLVSPVCILNFQDSTKENPCLHQVIVTEMHLISATAFWLKQIMPQWPQPQRRYAGIMLLQTLVNTSKCSTQPSIEVIPLIRKIMKLSHLATETLWDLSPLDLSRCSGPTYPGSIPQDLANRTSFRNNAIPVDLFPLPHTAHSLRTKTLANSPRRHHLPDRRPCSPRFRH